MAFPTLQRLGLSATVFLTVGRQSQPELDARLPDLHARAMLSWREIREMHEGGIEFGAHTLTHPDLTRLPTDEAKLEICTSKAMIEDALGVEVRSFCYPFGCYDSGSRDIVQAHFDCACTDSLGLVTASSDVYALKRMDAYYLRSDLLFKLMATRLFRFYVGARRVPRGAKRFLASFLRERAGVDSG